MAALETLPAILVFLGGPASLTFHGRGVISGGGLGASAQQQILLSGQQLPSHEQDECVFAHGEGAIEYLVRIKWHERAREARVNTFKTGGSLVRLESFSDEGIPLLRFVADEFSTGASAVAAARRFFPSVVAACGEDCAEALEDAVVVVRGSLHLSSLLQWRRCAEEDVTLDSSSDDSDGGGGDGMGGAGGGGTFHYSQLHIEQCAAQTAPGAAISQSEQQCSDHDYPGHSHSDGAAAAALVVDADGWASTRGPEAVALTPSTAIGSGFLPQHGLIPQQLEPLD